MTIAANGKFSEAQKAELRDAIARSKVAYEEERARLEMKQAEARKNGRERGEATSTKAPPRPRGGGARPDPPSAAAGLGEDVPAASSAQIPSSGETAARAAGSTPSHARAEPGSADSPPHMFPESREWPTDLETLDLAAKLMRTLCPFSGLPDEELEWQAVGVARLVVAGRGHGHPWRLGA